MLLSTWTSRSFPLCVEYTHVCMLSIHRMWDYFSEHFRWCGEFGCEPAYKRLSWEQHEDVDIVGWVEKWFFRFSFSPASFSCSSPFPFCSFVARELVLCLFVRCEDFDNSTIFPRSQLGSERGGWVEKRGREIFCKRNRRWRWLRRRRRRLGRVNTGEKETWNSVGVMARSSSVFNFV